MNNPELKQQVDNHRTFAIISRSSARKTTITEQLLLLDGATCQAGTVEGKKTSNLAKSGWTGVEKQRGISVTSFVMQSDYQGKRVNILDTPGYEDLPEDTYRALVIVDSTVIATGNAEGVEAWTKRLFQMAKKRGVPIFIFINKLDRDGREPSELSEELEELLGVESYPMNRSIDMREGLGGLYDIYYNHVESYRPGNYQGKRLVELDEDGLLPDNHPSAGNFLCKQVPEEVELSKEAGDTLSQEKITRGDRTPASFGSALTNSGVQTFLETFVELVPTPRGHKTQDDQMVNPYKEGFSGFIFKV